MKDMSEKYSELSDHALVAAAKGSQEALEMLIIRYQGLVKTCARSLYLVGADHEDLLQEGMIGLLTAARTFDPARDDSFSSYASLCIRTRMFSAIRSANALKHAPLNDSVSIQTFSFESLSDTSLKADPESRLIGREGFDEFMEALQAKLSATERQVLNVYLDGLSYAQIAQVIHRPVKSVDNAVQRIRKKAALLLGLNGSSV